MGNNPSSAIDNSGNDWIFLRGVGQNRHDMANLGQMFGLIHALIACGAITDGERVIIIGACDSPVTFIPFPNFTAPSIKEELNSFTDVMNDEILSDIKIVGESAGADTAL